MLEGMLDGRNRGPVEYMMEDTAPLDTICPLAVSIFTRATQQQNATDVCKWCGRSYPETRYCIATTFFLSRSLFIAGVDVVFRHRPCEKAPGDQGGEQNPTMFFRNNTKKKLSSTILCKSVRKSVMSTEYGHIRGVLFWRSGCKPLRLPCSGQNILSSIIVIFRNEVILSSPLRDITPNICPSPRKIPCSDLRSASIHHDVSTCGLRFLQPCTKSHSPSCGPCLRASNREGRFFYFRSCFKPSSSVFTPSPRLSQG